MSEALRPATHARHYAEPPQKTESDGTRHWVTRAANFVTVVSEAANGAVLTRDNPDEYMQQEACDEGPVVSRRPSGSTRAAGMPSSSSSSRWAASSGSS